MAYPGCNRIELQRLLVDLNMSEQVVVFKAETLQLFNNSVDTIGRMLRTNWPIDELRQRYLQFLDIFREIGVLLMQENEQLEPVQAFQIRTLLIHYYRRILLKDPALPLELLPTDWPAISARTLSMNIYKKYLNLPMNTSCLLPQQQKDQCQMPQHIIGAVSEVWWRQMRG